MISIVTPGSHPGDLLARRLASAPRPLQVTGADLDRFGAASVAAAGSDLHRLGDRRAPPGLLVAGIVAEVRRLGDGLRQIVQLRFPGDLVEPREHETVTALTRVRWADARPFLDWLGGGAPPALRLAYLQLRQEDGDRLRDHVVRLGRMTARGRIAHLLLEIHDRLARVGLAAGDTFHLPLVQETLSDMLGLSVVHLNRTLTAMRREGLVELSRGFVTLHDRDALAALSGYRATAEPQLSERGHAVA